MGHLMANTKRTITLTLDAETRGTEGVKQLASELEKLAQTGGEAAPEFERLGQELNEIAQQQDAVNGVREVSGALEQVKQDLDQARQAVENKKVSLDDLTAKLN